MINEQACGTRVAYGKRLERKVLRCLNEAYGFSLRESEVQEDKADKIDCWTEYEDRRWPCAIKSRSPVSGNDILASVREPFHGVHNPLTQVGRDQVTEYLWYITLDRDCRWIRVASGHHCHRIYEEMWAELSPQFAAGRRAYRSELHPGCELHRHIDKAEGHEKVLGFIPPSYLGKAVRYYRFLSAGKNQPTTAP